ncbi:hypothetical protein GCM10007096_25520 [Pullulanibacillus pueri]|uniref:Uncharacterized protein n=1 Tax=Pullulanibacillus pueri TaxID=1437324 RepID=A0A8J2ZXV2_9BACL|nr:hypothetical protein GCM10007096_25520 [Pullulanibacillus pueri]
MKVRVALCSITIKNNNDRVLLFFMIIKEIGRLDFSKANLFLKGKKTGYKEKTTLEWEIVSF